MFDFSVSPEGITLFASAALSLLCSYVPGLAPKFTALDPTWKRLIMLISMIVIVGGVFALSCAGFISGVECSKVGIWRLIVAFVLAVTANQSTYNLTPKVAGLNK